MDSFDILRIAIPFGVALALTHLIVLPIKSFLVGDDLRRLALRASTGNLLALVYCAAVLFLFGAEADSAFWGIARFLPAILVFVYSIGVWAHILMRSTRKHVLIDAAVFTVLALAAS